MSTWRPCDQVESAVAWKYGVERQDGPTALILSRQNLAQQDRTEEQLANIARGGYVLKDCAGQPELIFIATGSEVELAVAAWDKLSAEGVKARGFLCRLPTRSTSRMRPIVNPYCLKRFPLAWQWKRVSLTTGSNTWA
jgi:transketolase